MYCKYEVKEYCANVHTKKTEHAVETDEEASRRGIRGQREVETEK